MTWPTEIKTPEDIPHHGRMEQYRLDLGSRDAVCEFVEDNHDLLEGITAGDTAKEQFLGALLMQLANKSAVVTHEYVTQGRVLNTVRRIR